MRTQMSEKVAAQFKKLLLARRLEFIRGLGPTQEEAGAGQPSGELDQADSANAFHGEAREAGANARARLMAMDAALARIVGGK